MNEEKIREVLSDEKFVNSLLELETPEDVQQALEEKGISITVDEVKKIAGLLREKGNGELTDEELQDVAGGEFVFLVVATLTVVGLGTAADITHRLTRRRW